ncbi:unnamed protein product [Alopecurus aequalis]
MLTEQKARDPARAMDLVPVAMASLLPKLVKLLKEEYKLQEGVKKDVKSLARELGSTHAALRKVAEAVPRDQLGEQVRLWAINVRELSYDMEDVVDSFLVHVEGSGPASGTETLEELMKKMIDLFEKGKALPPIANVIRDIREQVLDVVAHGDRHKIDEVAANPDGTTNIFESCLVSLCKEQKDIVGIEGARDEVVRRLTDGDKQLKILSIFGFGGLGKTTLAKAVYDCLRVQYDYGAFVRVGRSSNLKDVYKDILIELREYAEDASLLDESQLIDKLRVVLENKRYFIVIEDICDIESWETIRLALTHDSAGSRIITTTRIFDVATKASDVYKLEPLSPDNSENLFCKILFSGKEKHTGCDQLAGVPNKILYKCSGVPLAIITIARLLACKPREDWSKVYSSIGSSYGDTKDVLDNTSKILLFCYYDLPPYLRICLLYLSTYPRNFMIPKETLIWKWVAEGFIIEEPGMGLFELGESYFNQLINRNMIQPAEEILYKGTIHECRVNDTMHDMICSLASQESFCTIVESNKTYTPPQSNARRLAIQNSDLGQDPLASTITSQVRSFHATMCHFSSTIMPVLSSFPILRVLAMEECKFITGHSYHLENLGRLLHLRYLELGNMPIWELPAEIGHLRFLQALDVRETYIQELPSSVGRLRQLKCLRASFSLIGVLDWVGNLTSLEELLLGHVSECPNFMKDLGKLTELRKLSIRIQELDESSSRALAESLCKLQKIQVLNLRHGFGISRTGASWDGYVPPCGLRDLRIRIWSSRLPPWINSSLLPRLTHLKVDVRSLETADLETLGRLPELVVLRLWTQTDSVGFPAATGGALFPKLRYCKMDLPLKFPPGAMPCLESIGFFLHLLSLKNAGFDFDDLSSLENLHCLERVGVVIYSMEAHERDFVKADTAVRHAIHIHPNHPILEIDCDYEYDIDDSDDDDGSDSDETDEEEMEDEDEDEEEEYTQSRRVRRRAS